MSPRSNKIFFLQGVWFICTFIWTERLRKHLLLHGLPCGVCETRPVTSDSLINDVRMCLYKPIHNCPTLSDTTRHQFFRRIQKIKLWLVSIISTNLYGICDYSRLYNDTIFYFLFPFVCTFTTANWNLSSLRLRSCHNDWTAPLEQFRLTAFYKDTLRGIYSFPKCVLIAELTQPIDAWPAKLLFFWPGSSF